MRTCVYRQMGRQSVRLDRTEKEKLDPKDSGGKLDMCCECDIRQ